MMELTHWWEQGRERNAHTRFTTRTGAARVYVRRNIADGRVIEIASISTIKGFGVARALYRTFLAEIPAIAENILNPDLDRMLERWGWTHAYRDLADTPTRVNPAFMRCFPDYANAHSAFHAILLSRDMNKESAS